MEDSLAVTGIEVVDGELQPATGGGLPTLGLADEKRLPVIADATDQAEAGSRAMIAAGQREVLILNAVVDEECPLRIDGRFELLSPAIRLPHDHAAVGRDRNRFPFRDGDAGVGPTDGAEHGHGLAIGFRLLRHERMSRRR